MLFEANNTNGGLFFIEPVYIMSTCGIDSREEKMDEKEFDLKIAQISASARSNWFT